jgi:hypothetical protein
MSTKLHSPLVEEDVKRNDVNVKLDAEVARKCKIVAAMRGIPIAEYLSEEMRPIVQRHIQQGMQDELRSDRPRRPKGGE